MTEVLLKGTQKKVCIYLDYYIGISNLISFCLKNLDPLPAFLFNLIKNNIENFDNILTQNPAYDYGIYPGEIYIYLM